MFRKRKNLISMHWWSEDWKKSEIRNLTRLLCSWSAWVWGVRVYSYMYLNAHVYIYIHNATTGPFCSFRFRAFSVPWFDHFVHCCYFMGSVFLLFHGIGQRLQCICCVSCRMFTTSRSIQHTCRKRITYSVVIKVVEQMINLKNICKIKFYSL